MYNQRSGIAQIDVLKISKDVDSDTIKNVKNIVNKIYNDYLIEPKQIHESLVGVLVNYDTNKWNIELDISPFGEMNFCLNSKNIKVEKVFLSIDDFFDKGAKYFS